MFSGQWIPLAWVAQNSNLEQQSVLFFFYKILVLLSEKECKWWLGVSRCFLISSVLQCPSSKLSTKNCFCLGIMVKYIGTKTTSVICNVSRIPKYNYSSINTQNTFHLNTSEMLKICWTTKGVWSIHKQDPLQCWNVTLVFVFCAYISWTNGQCNCHSHRNLPDFQEATLDF